MLKALIKSGTVRAVCLSALATGLIFTACSQPRYAASSPSSSSSSSRNTSRSFAFEDAEVIGYLDNPTPVYITDMDEPSYGYADAGDFDIQIARLQAELDAPDYTTDAGDAMVIARAVEGPERSEEVKESEESKQSEKPEIPEEPKRAQSQESQEKRKRPERPERPDNRTVERNVPATRMVSYRVNLGLTVKDPEATAKSVVELVKSGGGFIVEEATGKEFCNITARVPSQNLDAFIENAVTLGTVTNRQKNGTDITDQYRDNVVRLENLRTVRKRLLGLLDAAATVEEMLRIEKELERINVEIDLLAGRIKHAQESVAFSSVNIRIGVERKPFTEPDKAKPGPLGWIFVGLYYGVKWLFVWN